MKRDGFRIFIWAVMVFFACLAPAVGAQDKDMFLPKWSVGDSWLVKVVYPSPMVKDQWSAPVYWEYCVTGRETDGDAERYIVDVRERSGRVGLTARLFYRCADLSLARVDMEKLSRGETLCTTLVYAKGAPVVTERTLVPYDTPVFPFSGDGSAAYQVVKGSQGGVKLPKTYRQQVALVPVVDTEGLSDAGGLFYEVTCIDDKKGDLLFFQRWSPLYPGPVYGENRNMRYWLVME